MKLIAASIKDPAGMNIVDRLLELFDFEENGQFEGSPIYRKNDLGLVLTRKKLIYAGHLDDRFDPETIFFASKHRSASEKPTLTVHTPGNFTKEARYGGDPLRLAPSPANAMKIALHKLAEKELRYEVSFEATHHGPALNCPAMFVEIGSGLSEWRDEEAGRAVAEAIMAAAVEKYKWLVAIGVGGPHYAPHHTRVALETDIAIGHILPKYVLSKVDIGMVEQAVTRTVGDVQFAVIDWKGMRGRDRNRILRYLDELGIDYKRKRDIL